MTDCICGMKGATMTNWMVKEQIKAELRKERMKAKRLVERRDLASVNLKLVQDRISQLEALLPSAREGWQGY